MKIDDSDHRHELALFRYGLIADFVNLPPTTKGLYARIRRKADAEYVIPGTSRTRVASETIGDWLEAYRRGGFEALLPKPRVERSQSRTLPDEVVEVLATKQANPKLSVQLVIREALKHPEVPNGLPLPPSTVHRLLARHGLMAKPDEHGSDNDRRRLPSKLRGNCG